MHAPTCIFWANLTPCLLQLEACSDHCKAATAFALLGDASADHTAQAVQIRDLFAECCSAAIQD